jgi:regulatory protein
MKITAIKQQLAQQGRYSVYVAGKYSFSLSDTALLESKLVNGQEVDEAQIRVFKQLSADDKVYSQALRYAVMRPRSIWEMESYLNRKKIDSLLSQNILSKLSNNRLLDDETFARAWVANRRLLKPVSRRRLIQELRQKRVADETIGQVLAEDDTDERTTLRLLITRKRKQSKYQDDLKLMQYLARQGFNYDDIKTALATKGDEF